jgi:hypothetical protein
MDGRVDGEAVHPTLFIAAEYGIHNTNVSITVEENAKRQRAAPSPVEEYTEAYRG